MSDILEIVALNLRRLRRERKMTQTALAFRAEVDRSYLCRLESAQHNPTVQMLGKLAAAPGGKGGKRNSERGPSAG